MYAEDIREMEYCSSRNEHLNLFRVPREIAAQLADLNERLARNGPVPAPDWDDNADTL